MRLSSDKIGELTYFCRHYKDLYESIEYAIFSQHGSTEDKALAIQEPCKITSAMEYAMKNTAPELRKPMWNLITKKEKPHKNSREVYDARDQFFENMASQMNLK